jgi:hypothetical protein
MVKPSVNSDKGNTATSLETLNLFITRASPGTYVDVPTVLYNISKNLIEGMDVPTQ